MSDLAVVADQMQAQGLEPPPYLMTDGKVRRFGPKKRCWYVLKEARLSNGRHVVVGSFGDWANGRWRVEVDWKGIGEEERRQLQALRDAARQRERAERERAAAWAAMSASELWRRGSADGASPYLQRKGVQGESCRYLWDGTLLVPLLRYDLPREQALRAVQTIRPDGTKRFTKGFQKPGCCVRLGLVTLGEPLLVCEGYATGLSLRAAVGHRFPVFVALDAGNLRPVCELLRELYPASPILLCADDDWRTEGNPGRHHAWRTARAVAQAHMTFPVFPPTQPRGAKHTDYNDLHMVAGLHAVHRQLRGPLAALGVQLDALPTDSPASHDQPTAIHAAG